MKILDYYNVFSRLFIIFTPLTADCRRLVSVRYDHA